jgi:hypothetical protein
MAPALIPCPHCGCHAKTTDSLCPSCDEPLHRSDGSVQRSAVAVLLGLTAAGAFAATCGGTGPVVSQTGTSSGAGGADSTTGISSGALYGIATGTSSASGNTSTSSGEPVLYGPAMTTSSSGGTGGGGTDAGTD